MQITKLGYKTQIYGRQWRSPLYGHLLAVPLWGGGGGVWRGEGRENRAIRNLSSLAENFTSGKDTIGKWLTGIFFYLFFS